VYVPRTFDDFTWDLTNHGGSFYVNLPEGNRLACQRFPVASLAAALFIVYTFGAALTPSLSSYDPSAMATGPALAPPGLSHPFGTDRYGRDVVIAPSLSR
jgi:ABC-type dipeptide/oligopeptide/nickel transport system permease subunit